MVRILGLHRDIEGIWTVGQALPNVQVLRMDHTVATASVG